jgi:DNA repair exonuclease SbcCD ATPase subunit
MEIITRQIIEEVVEAKMDIMLGRYTGIIFEEFRSQLSGVIDLVKQNNTDIKELRKDIIRFDDRIDNLHTEIIELRTEMTNSFKDMGDIFHHLGNKVYDNLDPRVQRLEFARGQS